MSQKAQVTGLFSLVDESTLQNILSFDLSQVFKALTAVQEHTYVERQIVDSDGVVALDLGGVGTVKAMMLFVVGGSGTVTLKHDSNTNGMTINNGIILFGALSAVTVQTASTQALTIKYVFVQ